VRQRLVDGLAIGHLAHEDLAPFLEKATTDGVVPANRRPLADHDGIAGPQDDEDRMVVQRSIPTALGMPSLPVLEGVLNSDSL